MIQPSTLLRRAIQADAIVTGAVAVLQTFGAGMLAPLLNLPQPLLLETGLFLIAYTGGNRDCRQRSLGPWQHRADVQRRGNAQFARLRLHRRARDQHRRVWGVAVYRLAQEQWPGDGLSRGLIN
jgi:hypothetical protein